jgi:hypothetical protein
VCHFCLQSTKTTIQQQQQQKAHRQKSKRSGKLQSLIIIKKLHKKWKSFWIFSPVILCVYVFFCNLKFSIVFFFFFFLFLFVDIIMHKQTNIKNSYQLQWSCNVFPVSIVVVESRCRRRRRLVSSVHYMQFLLLIPRFLMYTFWKLKSFFSAVFSLPSLLFNSTSSQTSGRHPI